MDYKCEKCGSEELEPFHYIAYGDIAGVQIHYKFKCNNCGRTIGVEKNRKTHQIFKGTPWRRSKNAIRNQNKVEEYFEQRRAERQNTLSS
jgi:DNA-directed RNA polymerase subunit RPC12/RpoP